MGEKVKQVIVVRKDLNMRKGKLATQVAHSSLKVILDMMRVYKSVDLNSNGRSFIKRELEYSPESYLGDWIEGRFTKVCLSCDSEKELLDLYKATGDLGIPVALITDAGLTEFHGVATKTCIAIGPWESSEIDKITGKLKLL